MIQAKNMTKYYGLTKALDSFSLTVPEKKVFALLGPNGAGKTTFIKCILNLVSYDQGSLSLFDLSSSDVENKKRISYLPERFNFHSFYSSRAVVEFYSKIKNLNEIDIKDKIHEALKIVNMLDLADRPMGQMSKGQRQRVGLACLLLDDSDLIILDEPFSGLDPLGIRDLKLIIQNFKSKGKTVFLNSHILSEVESLCDEYAIINKGKLVEQGVMKQVLSERSLEEHFYGLLSSASDELTDQTNNHN